MVFKAVFMWMIVRAIVDHMLGRKQLRKLYRVSLSRSISISGFHKTVINTNSPSTLAFSDDSAAEAYDQAARFQRGEYAKTNFTLLEA